MEKAVCYVRVSIEEQARGGVSLGRGYSSGGRLAGA